jgi:hypothetical protein
MRDTIELAHEAGLIKTVDCCGVPDKFCGQDEWKGNIKAFEALVRADEREAFAKIQFESLLQAIRIEREACAALADKLEWADNKGVASAIRARGETK